MMLTLEQIEALMARMRALGIAELEYRHGDQQIRLVRDDDAAAPHTPPPAATRNGMGDKPAATPEVIAATMYGQFYAAPAPDAAPFVGVGDRVAAGQPLYVLDVMKTLTRIEAEFACIIRETLCANGQAVEPGTPLFAVTRLDEARNG
ncbi:acetyl-CoA carboxylase biotin carboxyl carrier protein [Nguyenibacter vanlangensis]|uniref:Biotin carboxyl carrier protein of acetyl-CoA carboxylase n=1 Tax=Nguyenibacter vanlangensis TaxID=1216886 RepID=A0A7Y7IYL0_9PROT|nr:biotin/lipoyl-containing protein [Nguyenibacter vanlangensis]NVN12798.1 acetyl-CoA carboxylase biotin carboxyl carrier protein subunit [Nguyenibacter vanlangensis]